MDRPSDFFSPRVNLMLAQLDTVREVCRLCEPGGDLADEVKRFVVTMERELTTMVPMLASWKTVVEDCGVYFYPSSVWSVSGSNGLGVAIGVLFLDVSELDADPGVGLRIPTNKQWPQSDDFRSELFDLLPHELRRMKWPELEWPLWRFIPISSTGETPDIAAFMDQTAEVVKAIAGLRPDIDRLLSSNR